MNPLTMRIFDVKSGIQQRFIDMCITTGKQSASAQHIFASIDKVMSDHSVPWENCVGISLDNASVNMGVHNSIKSRVLAKNPAAYVHGCPCHIVHNTCHSGAQEFRKVCCRMIKI